MPDSSAKEIHELTHGLGSRNAVRANASRARLCTIGPRSVEALIETLEGGDTRIRGRVMPLLALIQDPRGREPLIAMLLDRIPRLRETAAQCLGRFPSAEVVVALRRALARERAPRVRVAAMRSLVEQYAAGQEQALGPILDRLTDETLSRPVRLAACQVLGTLHPAQRRGILQRLARDPDVAVRQRATEVSGAAAADAKPTPEEISRLLIDLADDDYGVWHKSVHRLALAGAAAVPALVTEMRSRAHDPEYCARAGMGLKAMGSRRGRAIIDALDHVDEPVPLQVLVDVLGAFGDKSLLYRLRDLIESIARGCTDPSTEVDGFDSMQRVRAKAHLELARIGSRVAIRDLREGLSDPDRRVQPELLSAVELIGKPEEIGLLLRAYDREDPVVREQIGRVVRAIMKRERLRRNSRILQALGSRQGRLLQAILPPRRVHPDA